MIAGVVFTALANRDASAADQKHYFLSNTGGQNACAAAKFTADCKALFKMRHDLATFTNVAEGTFAAASVIAVGTVIYALVLRRKTLTSEVQAGPVVTENDAGMWVTGRW